MEEQTAADTIDPKQLRRDDREWILSLFGTAIGAGVLFLPIEASLGGIWPLVFMAAIIGPMVDLSHRGWRASA